VDTITLSLDDPTAIQQLVALLERGEVVALPTDTVYGVAADGFNADAVEKLFIAKDRPSTKAIMLLLGDYDDLQKAAVYVSPTAQRLTERFWPGGLTLVVEGRDDLPPISAPRTELSASAYPIPKSSARLFADWGDPLPRPAPTVPAAQTRAPRKMS